MVEKAPQSTAKQIQADLQTQGTTVSTRTIRLQLNERGFYGRRSRRTPLLRERETQESPTGVCQNTPEQAKILLGECPVDRWDQIRAFWWSTSSPCLQKTKWSLQGNYHLPYSQTWRKFSDVLGLLCCLWHWVPWMCAWHHGKSPNMIGPARSRAAE